VVTRGEVAPEEIPAYMNAADVLLITSDSEGSPTVVHEAMACGLPIVTVDVGDVPDRLTGCIPSAVVDRDPEALGRAVADIVQGRRRSNGPELVRPISHDVLANEILQVYASAARSS
jgi:glycosyltransferase involved in cell wall biosynthesis